jgi:hypothetical protein
MYEPHPKGIMIEYKEAVKTSSGVYLPQGMQNFELDEYNGDVIVATGKDVELYKVGDTVMFFPHSIPTSFQGKTSDGVSHKYQMFREADICCKCIAAVIEPPTTM